MRKSISLNFPFTECQWFTGMPERFGLPSFKPVVGKESQDLTRHNNVYNCSSNVKVRERTISVRRESLFCPESSFSLDLGPRNLQNRSLWFDLLQTDCSVCGVSVGCCRVSASLIIFLLPSWFQSVWRQTVFFCFIFSFNNVLPAGFSH